jgi:hypothetical protein
MTGGKAIFYDIHKHIFIFGIRINCLRSGRSRSLYLSLKDDKIYCCNYKVISILPTTYKILSNILLSRLTPYAEEIIGDYQCGFRRNWSTTDHKIWLRQILAKKREYNKEVHKLLIDFQKAYDTVRREVLYNIRIEFVIPMKLVRIIKLCLNETYGGVRVGKNLSDTFPIRTGLKQGGALSPLFFSVALDCVIRRVQVNQYGLKHRFECAVCCGWLTPPTAHSNLFQLFHDSGR